MGKKKIAQKTEGEILKEKAQFATAAKPVKAQAARIGEKTDGLVIYVNSTYNNTVMTAADRKGNVLAWSSAGSLGFSGPKKATPFAASKVTAVIAEKLKKVGSVNVDVVVKGVGGGRDSAIRSLASQGFNIVSVKDVTPIPHNGPRPPKVRRV